MKTILKNRFVVMENKINIILLLIFTCLGCDSFVEVDIPHNQLIGTAVFEEVATANAAMTNVYASIRDNGLLTGSSLGMSLELGVYSDELDFYGDASSSAFYFYTNAILPTETLVADYWNRTYNQIYAANAVYEGVGNSNALTEIDKNRLQGEALIIRGLLHFYLLNLFGDIPYITTTDYSINQSVNRIPMESVYNLMIADLEQAVTLLPENYYTADRARPNKSVAHSILAKVYLNAGRWADASNAASVVLNNTAFYNIESNLELVFLKESTETIWQLPTALEGSATDFADSFTLFAGPPSTVALAPDLVESFEVNDLRKQLWIGEVTDGISTWYFPQKYKQTSIQSSSSEYSIVLRLAEILLIRAEARAHQGDLIGALEDLNRIRQRAGLNETLANSQQDILIAILNERRFEFFTEFGHRFFDLKRNGMLDTVLANKKPGWNNTDSLFPIPQSELSANPSLLPQNPGY